MRKSSLISLLALFMLLLVAEVAATAHLARSSTMGAVCGVALAAVLLLMVGWRLRRDIAAVNDAIVRITGVNRVWTESEVTDFDGTHAVIARMQEEVGNRLSSAASERHQLEAVLDSMQDAVVSVDSGGRIVWSNGRMQRLLSAAHASTIRVGQALVQTVRDPEMLECVRTALAERRLEVRRSTSLVSGRIFEINASPMPGGGAVAVLHDVTRIEQVEQAQKDFVANVSHELRTPLTSITGYVETLLDENGLKPQAREFLETILKNATRMNRLTEDLLVMARVETPAVELNPEPVPADVLIHDAVKAMSGLVQENEATLELGAVTDCQVYADFDAVMQVLGNLIENAIKYGQPRGNRHARVLLSAREVHQPYDAVEFCVEDFGQGIASEHLHRIFERFYRVDKTRSRESGGTGLGLAIARHMVQSLGGTIRAESTLGAGSRFLFTLPKALYPLTLAD